jgi:hypothetical protein
VERKILWGEKASLNSGYTLDFLIESFHEHKCSDVLDKVYGLLGPLLSDKDFGGKIPEVNYAKTPAQLFDDVMIAVKESPRLRSPRALERFPKPYRRLSHFPWKMSLLRTSSSPNYLMAKPSPIIFARAWQRLRGRTNSPSVLLRSSSVPLCPDFLACASILFASGQFTDTLC